MTGLLDGLRGPADLRGMSDADLDRLAAEIRDRVVRTVARNAGHLGPNLGVVELTLALHRVFDSPTEPILWDVGHQAYPHKLVTGRARDFGTLRQKDGVSGYPSRAESEHDWIENSHASTALSYADGLAKAFALRGEDKPVVAVIGDGALTGGMAWEALNNIAACERPVIVVVNDNGRSYNPTVGGVADHLATLRLRPGYEKALLAIKDALQRTPVVGAPLYDALHGMKKGAKDLLAPQGMFEDLGLKYVGPIDGHDRVALEAALVKARGFGGPVIVHAVTQKGFGYAPALADEADQMHQSAGFDPDTGVATASGARRLTAVFADEMVRIGERRPDVVAITAAMQEPTGLGSFARRFPDRFFDVGIAEQHAMTSAAGLASGGLHPVVAVYATFLNRAFDQLLMDVALHKLPVTVVLDRAGITGDDGASHNGMWDMAMLGVVPGLRMAAPRDGATLRRQLDEALEVTDGPTVVRYSKAPMGDDIPSLRRTGGLGFDGVDVLAEPGRRPVDVLLVGVGATVPDVLVAAGAVEQAGFTVRVVDPCWVNPVPAALADLARASSLVVTVEDGVVAGGVGSRVAQFLRAQGVDVPTREIGIPVAFLDHAKVDQVKAAVGLTAQDIGRRVVEWATVVREPAETGSATPSASSDLRGTDHP